MKKDRKRITQKKSLNEKIIKRRSSFDQALMNLGVMGKWDIDIIKK